MESKPAPSTVVETKYPSVAVVGRLHGADEDIVEIFSNVTRAEAVQSFKEAIWKYSRVDLTPEERAAEEQGGDDGEKSVYINHVLASSSTIASV